MDRARCTRLKHRAPGPWPGRARKYPAPMGVQMDARSGVRARGEAVPDPRHNLPAIVEAAIRGRRLERGGGRRGQTLRADASGKHGQIIGYELHNACALGHFSASGRR
jgi:hypothetical protein